MSDPLAEIIAMLNLRAVLTKTIEGAGEWRVKRSDQGMSFYGVVPPEETFRLEQALRQSDLAARLTCVWQKGVRHRITPEALATTVAFFQQHL